MSSAPLVRLLGDAAALDMPPPRQDLAERLSQWLSAVDAVKLHGALQSIQALGHEPVSGLPPLRPWNPAHVLADMRKVRAALVADIQGSTAKVHGPEEDTEPTYAPILKRHLEMQRRMESAISPLRARVRQALTKGSPALRQLAALDALVEQTTSGREQKLLSTVPLYLERQFNACSPSGPGGAGLQSFGQAWQVALLAELDLRLQPVLGLLDALNHENTNENVNEIKKP
jgi:Protein of unknown function (DUF3348)